MSSFQNVIVDFNIFSNTVKAGIPSDTLPVPTINIPFPSMDSLLKKDDESGQGSQVLAVFQDIYQRLNLTPNNNTLTLILSTCTPLLTKQLLAKVFFDQLQVPQLSFADAPLMAAFGAAQSTCLSVLVNRNQERITIEICPVLDFVPSIQIAEHLEFDTNDADEREVQLAHAIWSLTNRCDAEKRRALIDNIVITGDSIDAVNKDKLSKNLEPFLAVSSFAADHQPVDTRHRSLPGYYNDMLSNVTKSTPTEDNHDNQPSTLEMVEKNLAWFGAMIASKAVFSDTKAHYRRDDWIRDGPRILTLN